MRIGIDGRFIRRGSSGNGVYSEQLVRHLARVDRHNAYTVYMLSKHMPVDQRNFRCKRMPPLHANAHCRFFFTFPAELIRNPVDIFHAIYTVPLLKRSRVLLSLIEFGWLSHPDEFPAPNLLKHQLRLMTRQSVHRADHIVTPTALGRDQLLDHFNLPETQVSVVPFGVDERFLKACSREEIARVKAHYGIHGDYILSVGDLHPRKNMKRLIDAFCILKNDRDIPHQLVLIGKKHWRGDETHHRASTCSAGDAIVFTGYVPFDHLRALYQGAAVFAFPSLYEGFGLPVHEAMASGTPVVVSNRGALPELAGDAALVVDPMRSEAMAHAIQRILEDDAKRKSLVEKGRTRIKAFSWRQACLKMVAIYREMGT